MTTSLQEVPDLTVTLLYVPATRPDRITKAMASGTDTVIIDLEDAVPAQEKDAARATVLERAPFLDGSVRIQVRVNGQDTPWFERDAALVDELPEHVGVRVPKVESGEQAAALVQRFRGRAVHALVESARGVEHMFAIAHSGVASLALGEADLRSDLCLPSGAGGDVGLRWVRSRLVVACAAAGLPSPSMSVFTRVQDDDGLRDTTREGRELGFIGRAAIHPRQLGVIREAFRPPDDEVERARATLERVSSSGGGTTLSDGSFVDPAMVRSARTTLELFELTSCSD